MKSTVIRAHHDAVKAIVDKVNTARAADYLLSFELYCDGDDCPCREIHLSVKDHDETLAKLIHRQGGFRCPLCGSWAKMHWLQTSRQVIEEEEHSARCSVNMQMMRRERTSEPGDIFSMSATETLDDRLPPTPEGWFEKASHIGRRIRRRFVREGEE